MIDIMVKNRKKAALAFPAILLGMFLLIGQDGWAGPQNKGSDRESLIVRSLKEKSANQSKGQGKNHSSQHQGVQKPRNNPKPDRNNSYQSQNYRPQPPARHPEQRQYQTSRHDHRTNYPPKQVYRAPRPAARHYAVQHRPRHVKALPGGFRNIHVGRVPYYYHSGIFYQRAASGFITVRAPLGAIVLSLPLGHRTVVVNRATYYCYDDIYYQRVPSGYRVVNTPAEVVPIEPIGYNPGDVVQVNMASLNLRTGPGRDFAVKGVLDQYRELEVMGGATDGWVYVKVSDENFGWVGVDYIMPMYAYPQG
ncbi:MAG: SH3 domain-containing protein [Desulfatibacillum sp.]|nr:SH3 domain-containing protein [Desulfatibacillum sp.]